jgi:DNA-binding NtrC family response regulator
MTPVGSCEELEVDVRVVAATHRDLGAMAEQGRFRLDLYHRLNSVVLRIPPLRERPEEIMPLVEHFLDQFITGGPRPGIGDDVQARLLAYRWPGNVRELRNVVERAVALIEGDSICGDDLPSHVGATTGVAIFAEPAVEPPSPKLTPAILTAHEVGLRASLRQHEVGLIKDALRRSEGNQRRAASLLRLPLRTFERKLKILGMRGAN